MLRIRCPFCGLRDESEFRYRGDASVVRPVPDAGEAAFVEYVYQRGNPHAKHLEWWMHVGGCRQALMVERDAATHRISEVLLPAGREAL